jgi:hypothetical protein
VVTFHDVNFVVNIGALRGLVPYFNPVFVLAMLVRS